MDESNLRLRRLMNVGRQLVSELDPDVVLDRLLEEARTATGARFAALGILNEERTELERLLHIGIDEETVRNINELPRGRGVLGVLIDHPEPLRLEEVGDHPESFGFPVAHPPMHTFLGVSIMIRGQAWGNLYLSEKENGEPFSEEDEDAAGILADWAATAIDNARIYHESEARRAELERAVRGLDAARSIADAIGAEGDLGRILELIVKRGRALVDARAMLILLRNGDELVISSTAGEIEDVRGRSVPVAGTQSGEAIGTGRPFRVDGARDDRAISIDYMGVTTISSVIGVPMMHRGEGLGVLLAFDRGAERAAFTEADEALMRTFAASAANAVAISRSVEADRLRSTIAAAETERRRWARELHDETLQALGGLRVLLAGALRRNDPESTVQTVIQAIADIEDEIANLRSLITELRPMLLDDLGLGPAIEALIDRRRAGGLEISASLVLGDATGPYPLSPEAETTIYRLVQESLTNVVKHSRASHIDVKVELNPGAAVVSLSDDGVGFDTSESVAGFGLAGIRERVYLAGGVLEIDSAPGSGTRLRASLPLAGGELLADEAVSDGRLAHGVR